MSTRTKIFLAHASEDKHMVREIHSKLETYGFNPWLDEIDLLPGQYWQTEIPKAIRESDVFVACLSQLSVSKQGYVQREFRTALNVYAEKPPGSIYLIPLKLDNCEVPDLQLPQIGVSLRDIQWLDYWRPGGLDRLVQAIEAATRDPSSSWRESAHPPTSQTPADDVHARALSLTVSREGSILHLSASNRGTHLIRDIEINAIPDDDDWFEQTHGPLPKLKQQGARGAEVVYPIVGGWFYATVYQLNPNRGLVLASFELNAGDYTRMDFDVFWNDHTGMQRKAHAVANLLSLAYEQVPLEPRATPGPS